MNLELEEWPEGFIALDWVAAIEALDDEGNVVLVTRTSKNVTAWKAAGMALSLSDDMRSALQCPEMGD